MRKLTLFSKSLRSKKKMLELTWFCYVSQKICERLFAEANQDSTFSHTREN